MSPAHRIHRNPERRATTELAEARAWWTKAAEAGHTDAQLILGALLTDLDPPELAEARTWLTKATEAGDAEAQYNHEVFTFSEGLVHVWAVRSVTSGDGGRGRAVAGK